MDKPLWGLRVQAPVARVGSGLGPGRCFPVFPKVDTPYGQALTGLRVDGPLGRRFLRGLSLTAALPLRVVVGALHL